MNQFSSDIKWMDMRCRFKSDWHFSFILNMRTRTVALKRNSINDFRSTWLMSPFCHIMFSPSTRNGWHCGLHFKVMDVTDWRHFIRFYSWPNAQSDQVNFIFENGIRFLHTFQITFYKIEDLNWVSWVRHFESKIWRKTSISMYDTFIHINLIILEFMNQSTQMHEFKRLQEKYSKWLKLNTRSWTRFYG